MSAYWRLLIFLPAIQIIACDSSSQAVFMMYSAYKLNKEGDNTYHTALHENVPLISLIFLKRSLVFPILLFSLFLCIVHWRRPSYLFLLFSGTLHPVWYIFPFLPCFLFLFFSQLFVKLPQKSTLPSCISSSFGWVCSLSYVQYYKPLSIAFQALCLPNLICWIYWSPPLYTHKGFDLGHTWMAWWFSPISLVKAWILW